MSNPVKKLITTQNIFIKNDIFMEDGFTFGNDLIMDILYKDFIRKKEKNVSLIKTKYKTATTQNRCQALQNT